MNRYVQADASTRALIAGPLLLGFAAPANAEVRVGGAPMHASKDIMDNAANSQDHTTLVAAVQAAGLTEMLKGPGPFTVFAPVNAAFAALPPSAVDTLLQPENKAMLTKVLTLHVVPGKLDAVALMGMMEAGRATLRTLEGESLTATAPGGVVTLTDAQGRIAHVTTPNVIQSNGVVHVVDCVLLPE